MSDLASLYIKVDSKGVVTASKDLDNLTGKSRGAEKATESVTRGFSKMQKVVMALATSYAALKMAQYIKDATLLAARYETLGVVMRVVGNNAGYTGAQMEEFAQGLQKAGIAMVESRNTLARMIQAQIDLASSQKLARIAQDAAVIGSINSSEAFERLIYGIQTGMPRILRTIGLNVQFQQSYKALATQLGKNVDQLSETEIMQARVNTIVKAGAMIAGTYEGAMETAGKQLLSMKRHLDNIKVGFGLAFTPALAEIIETITADLKSVNGELSGESRDAIHDWGVNFRINIISVEAELMRMGMLLDKIGGTMTSAQMLLYGPGAALGIESSTKRFEAAADANMEYEKRYKATDKALEALALKQIKLEQSLTPEYKAAAKAAQDAAEKKILARQKDTADTAKALGEWKALQQEYWEATTEGQLQQLEIQYQNFVGVVEDEVELEQWKAARILEIQAEAANQSVALYQELYEATGLDQYAEKAIEAYSKVMDAAEETWGGILDNEEDVATLRLKKEQDFADQLYGIFDDIVDAEQNMADDRLRVIEDYNADRSASESRAAISSRDPHMVGVGIAPGTVIRVYTGNKAQAEAYAKMQDELERVAANTARTAHLAQEQAQREAQRWLEEKQKAATGQYERLTDWLIDRQRSGWGLSDWQNQFGAVSEYAAALDPSEAGFYENGLDALENMVDILFRIDSMEQEMVAEQKRLNETLLSSMTTIDDTIISLTTGADAPVQSYQTFQTIYQEKLTAAFDSPENIGAFTSFLEQSFLPFMQSYGSEGSYTAAFDDVLSSLQLLKGMYGAEYIGGAVDPLAGFDIQSFADEMNAAFDSLDTSGAVDSLDGFAGEINGAFDSLDTSSAISSLEGVIDVLGLVPGTAQTIIDKMQAGSSFQAAFADTVGALTALQGPVEGVGTTSDWTAGSAEGLTTELAATLAPFDALSLNLDAMSQNVQNKTAEVANFFTVLADSLGLVFTGEGGIAAAIESLTPAPAAVTAISTVETSPYISAHQVGIIGHGGYWQEAEPAHGFIILSDGNKTYYGAGGLTDGIGMAGEMGPEWVVPTYEPQRSNFLADVGVDPDAIGRAIAKHINVEGGGGDIAVSVSIDGREIGNVTAKQVKTNKDLQDSIRRLN